LHNNDYIATLVLSTLWICSELGNFHCQADKRPCESAYGDILNAGIYGTTCKLG